MNLWDFSQNKKKYNSLFSNWDDLKVLNNDKGVVNFN